MPLHYLTTKMVNFLTASGFLASSNGGRILTSRSWKCRNFYEIIGELDWTSVGYDDSSWPDAVEYDRNGDNIHDNIIQINSSAFWIWSANKTTDFFVACRLILP